MPAPPPPPVRKIIHVDMDAFYAAVEQRDHPELRGKPVIVGGQPNSRGVVATCSYEARAFGVRSAMPSSQAMRLCPEAIFVPPRFEVYREISGEIRDIFLDVTDLVEGISLDEAYLDVTTSSACQGSATLIAREIKERIRDTTGLTASAGVSYNKFLAKIASDRNKPDGLCCILPREAADILRTMPVGRFHGIGPATERKLSAMGVETGADLERLSLETLSQHFGKAGEYYYRIVRGQDDRPVGRFSPPRVTSAAPGHRGRWLRRARLSMEFLMHIDAQGYVLPIAPALLDLLRQPLQLLLCPPQQRLIVRFRDPDYDPVADAGADRYPAVEIAINGAGRLQWITAFAYPDADGVTELGRELDFDFARGIFQHWGSCQPLLQGAAIFQWWQAHFLHAARNGVFAIQVRTP